MAVFSDMRGFLSLLEKRGLLRRVSVEVDPELEVAEIMERLVQRGGPAVVFERVKGSGMPIVANLYGTRERVALGLGVAEDEFVKIGEFIALLQKPAPPEGLWDAVKKIPFFGKALTLGPKTVSKAPCQEVVREGGEATLAGIPVIKCWPRDAGPLVTWPLVVTAPPSRTAGHAGRESVGGGGGTGGGGGPRNGPQNVGIYRMQVLDERRLIMRWLRHRGGARHLRLWKALERPMPVAVALGCEPATTIAAVTPVPEDIGEFHFAGVLRKKAVELVPCRTIPLKVPATAEIVLEGEIRHGETALEGPFADHTGYYNSAEEFPVFHLKAVTMRRSPMYLTTITGRPPKEDAVIGTVLNDIYLPTLRAQFPEIVDFSLPMEAVSYRIAVVAIKKQYPGHARRIMMGLWGVLKQFMYVKYIIVVDDDIDVHRWDDVIWAISTRVDPGRDTFIIENTPIDYLDFASPLESLGGKLGIDATNKMPPEVTRPWGEKVEMERAVRDLVDGKWKDYGID